MIADAVQHVVDEAQYVNQLDPLGLDQFFMKKLPACNLDGATGPIIEQVQQLKLEELELTTVSKPQALAITRDLGFIAASLERHMVALADAPGLTRTMYRLAPLTQEIPRDTIYSYTIRNPGQQKRRSFTGYYEELVFIEALERGVEDCLKCLPILVDVLAMPPHDPQCVAMVRQCTEYTKTSVTVMLKVREVLPPRFFSEELRPYFPPVMVEGHQYFAPNGGQMPLALFDWLVWGVDVEDKDFWEFFYDIIEYYPYELRTIPKSVGIKQSLVTKTITALQQHPNDAQILALAKTVEQLLDMLLKFRFPHIKVARDNLQIRPANSKGSGGYDDTMLQRLVDATVAAKQRLHRARLPMGLC